MSGFEKFLMGVVIAVLLAALGRWLWQMLYPIFHVLTL